MGRTLTTQDVSWFLDLYDKGQLDLDPPYQRRSVWSPKDRRYFIDTILNNYPAPPIFLHKTLDEAGRSTYHVVDGKQRLQTIILFRDNKVAIPADFSDVTLQNKRWKSLEKGTRENFWNYILIVEMLPDASQSAIKNTFERINRNSRKLTPQEMRHAKYDGWFIRAVEAEASREEWKNLGVVTTARTKRMSDTQFISELFAVIIRQAISGFDQDDLDQIYADFDDLDEVEDFDDDAFFAKLSSTVSALMGILEAEPTSLDYLKSHGHFYTLWSVIALKGSELPPVPELSHCYTSFMAVVSERLSGQVGDSSGAASDFDMLATEYATNFRGASTDKTQREVRFTALLKALKS